MARERTDVPNPVYDIFGISLASPEPCIKTKDFDPFSVKRSTGLGVRIFLPMFGLLGFDYGWRLDDSNYGNGASMQKGQFHFTIGASI